MSSRAYLGVAGLLHLATVVAGTAGCGDSDSGEDATVRDGSASDASDSSIDADGGVVDSGGADGAMTDGGSADGGIPDVAIPAASDWTLVTEDALVPGGPGAWDVRFPHGTPGPVMRVGSTWHLYYVGADGDRPSDGGPAHRGVGLATAPSPEGPWTKSPANPVIPWEDIENDGDDEEGAWRIAGFVDDGTVLLYVSDLLGSGGSVNGDIRLYASADGVSFTDEGIVLDHGDGRFPGDDEMGVLGAWKDGGTYYLYYTAKGGDVPSWSWALAAGPGRNDFTRGEVLDSSQEYGHGTDPIFVSDTTLVVFMGDNGGDFWSWTPPRADPTAATDTASRVSEYAGLSSDQFAIILDRATATWYGFFTTGARGDSTSIDVYSASADP